MGYCAKDLVSGLVPRWAAGLDLVESRADVPWLCMPDLEQGRVVQD
jgi:hypothetical protein